jgi:MoaA/NifB/PqqE/SkfB family radical SAM enzyme
MKKYDKNFLLTESKTFCMFPWVHLNVTPTGDMYPCCTTNYLKPFANAKKSTLKDAFNHDVLKQLRLNMLNGVKSDACNFCYKHEEAGPYSFRKYSINNFEKHFDDVVTTTQDDGTVPEFKMAYFDIRFRNICNFKCRTCGAEFSSQWAAEERLLPNNKNAPILLVADGNKGTLIDEVLTHVDHMEIAYFAGGEPLITDEHYILLEEMIRRGKTDITLRYNTNASNIKYKNHDVIGLWKHFKRVELSCSIDHYGERAEWIRHGTDWGTVESNLLTLRELDFVSFQINTVFSIFNYFTLNEFYTYLKSKRLIRNDDWHTTLYLAVHPSYYSAVSLPKSLKEVAKEKSKQFIASNGTDYKKLTELVTDAINFADNDNKWNSSKEEFFKHTTYLDKIRNEDFFKTFPELKPLEELNE